MTSATAAGSDRARAIAPGAGPAYWWFGELATIKLPAEATGGAFSLVEVEAPAGLEVPLHVHHREDETFIVTAGTAEFTIGEERVEATAGSVLYGPRGVPHGYVAGPAGALIHYVFTPGGFEGFVPDTGEPARSRTVPPAGRGEPDSERLEAAVARYGVELIP